MEIIGGIMFVLILLLLVLCVVGCILKIKYQLKTKKQASVTSKTK